MDGGDRLFVPGSLARAIFTPPVGAIFFLPTPPTRNTRTDTHTYAHAKQGLKTEAQEKPVPRRAQPHGLIRTRARTRLQYKQTNKPVLFDFLET